MNVNGSKAEKKRKNASFDEDVEGFQFTRLPSKKPRPSIEAIPEVPSSAPEDAPRQASPPRRGRPKKQAQPQPQAQEEFTDVVEERPKRSTRGTKASVEPEPQPENAQRSSRKRDQSDAAAAEKKRRKGRPSKSKPDERNGFVSPEQQGTKITLPMADTPVMQRNKEMRTAAKSEKGNRRSSLGMRGRRASSLIDSGASNALPHKEVNTADFYKHIGPDLPEPRRMRQLLIWCATRAMGDKPSGSRSEDESARLAARVIQEELLKDFSTNSDLSNWFGREDSAPPAVVVKKPHPKNVQNAEKIKELEEQIQRLQRERHSMNALLRPPSIPRIKPPIPKPDEPSQPDSAQPPRPSETNTKIDLSLLDPSQQKLLASLEPTTAQAPEPEPSSSSTSNTTPTPLPPIPPSAVASRLSRITNNLAPTLDSLAAGIHDIELYRSMSDRVSSRVLRICAERLDERDARNAMYRLAIEGSSDGESEDGSGSKKEKVALRERPREDLGVILGALSRVERR